MYKIIHSKILMFLFLLGSRATSVFRFGFISLDMISVILHDSGEYVCRISNAAGVAESRANLSVTRKFKSKTTFLLVLFG